MQKCSIKEKQYIIIYYYLWLQKEADLLYKREKIIFIYKLENIDYLDCLKREAAASEMDIILEPSILLIVVKSIPDLLILIFLLTGLKIVSLSIK